jgi:GMP reductase
MKLALSYSDVVLLPCYSEIVSRDKVSTSIAFLDKKINNPITPSNMACTISFEKAKEFSDRGYFYVLHRFYPYEDIFKWVEKSQNLYLISLSIGVKHRDYTFLNQLAESKLNVDFITVDVAHGHNLNVKLICEYFHSLNWKIKPKLIVGNAGTIQAVSDMVSWGADAVKVGLSMGYACTTYNTTGVGTPMYSIIREINEAMLSNIIPTVPIIADGQVREYGDACKALHAGASLVMVGSMFAACKDSPAPSENLSGLIVKKFYGSASEQNKGEDKYTEGRCTTLNISTISMLELMDKFEQAIRSAMSYAGVTSPYRLYLMEARQRT